MHVKRLFRSVGLTVLLVTIIAIAGFAIVPVEAAPDGISELKVVSEAYSWLGVPYKYGGESRSGIDCSGLVRQVYMKASMWQAYYKDRTAEEIRRASYPVWPPRPGDVVIFINKTTGKCTHVGIYIGPSRYGYWDAYFISAVHNIGRDYPMKVELDRLYFSKHGTGIWYKYFYIYFARYNPDSWGGCI
jgi:cell wall-associated NlpC family hydrolase